MLIALLIAYIFVFFASRRRLSGADRQFYNIFLISSIYFGILGPWYWQTFESGYFLGVNWSADMDNVSLSFFGVFFLVSLYLPLLRKSAASSAVEKEIIAKATFTEKMFLAFGMVAVAYVVLKAGSFTNREDLNQRDPLLLIMTQASDILVPVILFRICRQGFTFSNLSLSAIFLVFTLFVGLRYKTIIFVYPLISILMYRNKGIYKWGLVGGIALGTLLLFSVMTIYRAKFSGINSAGGESLTGDKLLYGLFAESNLIFGLLAIFKSYTSTGDYVYFAPFVDAIQDWFPRYLFPDKQVGLYLSKLYDGLGSSRTGTAYPFFGEYYMMAGWTGLLLGVPLYLHIYKYFSRRITVNARNAQLANCGAALLAIFWGYCYFSRGFTSQTVKGVIFIVIPYIALLKASAPEPIIRKNAPNTRPQPLRQRYRY